MQHGTPLGSPLPTAVPSGQIHMRSSSIEITPFTPSTIYMVSFVYGSKEVMVWQVPSPLAPIQALTRISTLYLSASQVTYTSTTRHKLESAYGERTWIAPYQRCTPNIRVTVSSSILMLLCTARCQTITKSSNDLSTAMIISWQLLQEQAARDISQTHCTVLVESLLPPASTCTWRTATTIEFSASIEVNWMEQQSLVEKHSERSNFVIRQQWCWMLMAIYSLRTPTTTESSDQDRMDFDAWSAVRMDMGQHPINYILLRTWLSIAMGISSSLIPTIIACRSSSYRSIRAVSETDGATGFVAHITLWAEMGSSTHTALQLSYSLDVLSRWMRITHRKTNYWKWRLHLSKVHIESMLPESRRRWGRMDLRLEEKTGSTGTEVAGTQRTLVASRYRYGYVSLFKENRHASFLDPFRTSRSRSQLIQRRPSASRSSNSSVRHSQRRAVCCLKLGALFIEWSSGVLRSVMGDSLRHSEIFFIVFCDCNATLSTRVLIIIEVRSLADSDNSEPNTHSSFKRPSID